DGTAVRKLHAVHGCRRMIFQFAHAASFNGFTWSYALRIEGHLRSHVRRKRINKSPVQRLLESRADVLEKIQRGFVFRRWMEMNIHPWQFLLKRNISEMRENRMFNTTT